MSDCCGEPTCNRIKPLILMRGDNAVWYVATAYNEKKDTGQFIPYQKHTLPQDAQNMLNDMFYAQFFLLSTCTALDTSPKGIMERLGLDPNKLYGKKAVEGGSDIRLYPDLP